MSAAIKVVRRRGLQCPFNSSQYVSIFLHTLTTACFIAFNITECLKSNQLISIIVFSLLTTVIISCWLFTSLVDSSLPASSTCERIFCGTLYCFKRANLKTRYCAVSKKKVPGMDHFCVWMNTAIGSRNYSSFFMVALLSTLLMWFQIVLSVVALVNGASENTTTLVVSIIQLLCSLCVALPYNTLLLFHVYLICNQTSTFDYLMLRAQHKAAKRKALKAVQNGNLEQKIENKETTTTTNYTNDDEVA
jgi:palmitoyltransferase ZDHHC1/11